MNLSQDEIHDILNGNMDDTGEILSGASGESVTASDDELHASYMLTNTEVDTLGEVGNICMGAVATTMYSLLDRRVSITTPHVSVHTTSEVLAMYQVPFVVVEVEYIEGIKGKNLLLLKEPDAALITDLLTGGDGTFEEPIVLNELHMSAISEIMNQMIGASATALSKVIGEPVNISPPNSIRVDIDTDVGEIIDISQMVVRVSFDMVIEGLLSSQLLQIIPFNTGIELAKKVNSVYSPAEDPAGSPAAVADPAPGDSPAQPAAYEPPSPTPEIPVAASYNSVPTGAPAYSPPPQSVPSSAAQAALSQQQAPAPPVPGNLVDVRPVSYQSFDVGVPQGTVTPKGMDLVHDIPLQVSVELGKTKKEINEILEFSLGTVIVLDKISGDPVEILVNGKLIAKGEVVVIDENYGVRITEINM